MKITTQTGGIYANIHHCDGCGLDHPNLWLYTKNGRTDLFENICPTSGYALVLKLEVI